VTPVAAQITTLPEQLRRWLVWDQGAEMAQHAQNRIDTWSPWPSMRGGCNSIVNG
jgi:hypothetical protein